MPSYTEEEQAIIANGDLAEAALKTPAFASAINELSEHIANSIIGTAPSDTKKREELYFIHVGLREVVGILNQRVALKQELLSRSETQENE